MAGITHLYGIASSTPAIIALIAIMAFVTFLSVRGGIDKGIRILSEVNMWIALGVDPVSYWRQARRWFCSAISSSNLATYIQLLPAFSNPDGRTDTGFYNDWTAYYWTWWISWAPFVGLFMARISLGRTVREFMAGAIDRANLALVYCG